MEINNQQIWGKDVYDRIMSKIDKSGDCWVWTGGTGNSGYGRMRINKKLYSPHRLMWEIYNKKLILNNMEICHKCDNRLCINPEHLFMGTHRDNMKDCSKKRRVHGILDEFGKSIDNGYRFKIGNIPIGRKLAKEDIINILNYLKNGYTQREIGEMYNVSHTTILDIKRGKCYVNITGIKYKGELPI